MPTPIQAGDWVYYECKMGDRRYHIFKVEEVRRVTRQDLKHAEDFEYVQKEGLRVFLTPIAASMSVCQWAVLDTRQPSFSLKHVRRCRPTTAIKRGWLGPTQVI